MALLVGRLGQRTAVGAYRHRGAVGVNGRVGGRGAAGGAVGVVAHGGRVDRGDQRLERGRPDFVAVVVKMNPVVGGHW